jgi:hypothetical protein
MSAVRVRHRPPDFPDCNLSVVFAHFPRRIERQRVPWRELNSPVALRSPARDKPEHRSITFDGEWPYPDVGANPSRKRDKVPFRGFGRAPTRVAASCSYQLYDVLNELAVIIEKKRADKISCYAAATIELPVHKEQTSIGQTANVVYMPFVRDQSDFLWRCIFHNKISGLGCSAKTDPVKYKCTRKKLPSSHREAPEFTPAPPTAPPDARWCAPRPACPGR